MAKRSRRYLGWLPGIVLIALLTAGCGGTSPSPARQQAGPPDLAQIIARGTLRVCSTGDYRPFTYRDPTGEWSGMDIDLANDLAKRLKVELELVPTTWGSMMTDLGGKCDAAMGGITVTLDRAQRALYSAAYLRDGKAAIVRCSDQAKYGTLDAIDVPGVRVVVNPGGTNADFDKAHLTHATIVNYPDNNSIFGQLVDNHADVMITDASEVRYEALNNRQLCTESTDHPFSYEQKAYLIPQGNVALQQWMNQWLNIAENDGTYAAASTKWLGQVMGP
jgi:cyclohexadienyl dehydratase